MKRIEEHVQDAAQRRVRSAYVVQTDNAKSVLNETSYHGAGAIQEIAT